MKHERRYGDRLQVIFPPEEMPNAYDRQDSILPVADVVTMMAVGLTSRGSDRPAFRG